MCCTDQKMRRRVWAALVGLGVVAGCSSPSSPESSPAAAPSRAAVTASPPTSSRPTSSASLPAPGAVRNWTELRAQAARRLVAANPEMTYTGAVPDILLAIPVLEVELNGDGSVRRIDVLRHPRQATDTVKLATDAVHRAAPFGDVSRLPKPWRFTETFLFNEDRKFKPRTLDP